jgi:hypothetical protein
MNLSRGGRGMSFFNQKTCRPLALGARLNVSGLMKEEEEGVEQVVSASANIQLLVPNLGAENISFCQYL